MCQRYKMFPKDLDNWIENDIMYMTIMTSITNGMNWTSIHKNCLR